MTLDEKAPITVTVEQLRDAFVAVNFRDPAEWHWQKFIKALRTIAEDVTHTQRRQSNGR